MTSMGRTVYEGMLSEMVKFYGRNGDVMGAYLARPLGSGPHLGIIVIHEVFGLVEHTKELVRKFAAHAYIAITLLT
jgi:carboxymethylenebutenolidase